MSPAPEETSNSMEGVIAGADKHPLHCKGILENIETRQSTRIGDEAEPPSRAPSSKEYKLDVVGI